MFRVLLYDDGAPGALLLRDAALAAGCEIVGEEHDPYRLADAIETLSPDAVLMDVESPGRDVLEQVVISTRHDARPIVMFTADGSDTAIEAALQAGVSAYIVDGVDAGRLLSILQVAITRFRVDRHLRQKLESAEQRLLERKVVDRAKALLIEHHRLSEHEAYAALRTAAMQQNRKLVDVARAVIAAAETTSG